MVLSPSPIWPAVPRPQQKTSPVDESEHAWNEPPETCFIAELPIVFAATTFTFASRLPARSRARTTK